MKLAIHSDFLITWELPVPHRLKSCGIANGCSLTATRHQSWTTPALITSPSPKTKSELKGLTHGSTITITGRSNGDTGFIPDSLKKKKSSYSISWSSKRIRTRDYDFSMPTASIRGLNWK